MAWDCLREKCSWFTESWDWGRNMRDLLGKDLSFFVTTNRIGLNDSTISFFYLPISSLPRLLFAIYIHTCASVGQPGSRGKAAGSSA